MSRVARDVFITGGTGYIGQRLIPLLLSRGHRVRVLTREKSIDRVPAGAFPVTGDALNAASFVSALKPEETFVQLVGTPHPSPAKVKEFQSVDLVSVQAAVAAAKRTGVFHFIYLSVAQPAPVMREYQAVRAEGERLIAEANFTATVLRPWYVLGPGHRWPIFLLPGYWIASLIPSARAGVKRLGFVSLKQMVNAIVNSIENPPPTGTIRKLEVPEIRKASTLRST